jgi:hypothetical protein
MPTLITTADVVLRFDISPDIDTGRIDPHVGTASRRLRRWVGEANYALALAGAGDDVDMQADLQNAEAHLVYHYLVYGANFPFTSKGIIATSMSGEGKEMRKYLTPAETQAVAQQMLDMAREIAEPYMLSDGTPTGGFELVEETDVC